MSGALRAIGKIAFRVSPILLLALFWSVSSVQTKTPAGVYDGLESCGNDLITPQQCPLCGPTPAFEMEGYWHRLTQCTHDIRDLWNKHGPLYPTDLPGAPTIADLARAEIIQEMTRPRVMFISEGHTLPFGEVFNASLTPQRSISHAMLTNDLGVAYNGMGQSGLALYLYHLTALAERGGYDAAARDATFYRTLARGAIHTVLSPVAVGGLANATPCMLAPEESCVWYHSVTRRDQRSEAGGTLNQMLHVVRDLGSIAQLADKEGWVEPFDFDAHFEGGLNQLFLAAPFAEHGDTPNLADYVSPEAGPNGAFWAYYGYNLERSRNLKGYFLKSPTKNCSYHVHVLQLLGTSFKFAEKRGLAHRARIQAFTPGSALLEFSHAAEDSGHGKISTRVQCTPISATKSKKAIRTLRNLKRRFAK